MQPNESEFTINVTADSGESYAGTFRIRKRLSHMQNLRKDELRRELIGKNPEYAPETVARNAFILSTCIGHIINAPTWWQEASNGLDLLDQEPVSAVFDEVTKILAKSNEELSKKAEAAKAALK